MNALFAVSTTTGRIRKQNQDRFYLNGRTMPTQQENCSLAGLSRAKEQVFSVCDGMGGEEYGEIAAQLAVEALGQVPPEALRGDWSEYIRRANDLILRFARERQVRAGTTFAGLSLRGNHLSALNVGDSRIYLIREGKITQLSRDHTEFQAMVEAGIFAPSDFHNQFFCLGIRRKPLQFTHLYPSFISCKKDSILLWSIVIHLHCKQNELNCQ